MVPPKAPQPAQARDLRIAMLLVVLVGAASYARAPWAGFVWDDHRVIVDRRLPADLGGMVALFAHNAVYVVGLDARAGLDTYRPLPLATFFIEENLVGRRPALFHVDSVLLHLTAALLLLLLGRALGASLRAALFAALVFAAHPAIAEAVYWVNGRSDPLCVVFFLGALLAWLRGRTIPVVVLVLLSSLSKETAFVLIPPIVLLLPHRRGPARPAVIALAPWLAGAVLGAALRVGALRHSGVSDGSQHVGYALRRLPVVLGDALMALLLPAAESPMTLEFRYRAVSPGAVITGVLVVLALLACAALCFWRGRRIEAWAIATFLMVTAPVALLTYMRGYIGWGRYLYPSAPMLALALAVAVEQRVVPRLREQLRRALAVAGALLIGLLAVQTFAAGDDWHDQRGLATAMVRDHPADPAGHLLLIRVEQSAGRTEQAGGHALRAAQLDPWSDTAWSQAAHFLMLNGRRGEAFVAAERAQRLHPGDPVSARILAIGLLERKSEAAAARILVEAIVANPQDEGAAQTLREAAARLGAGSEFVTTVRAQLGDPRLSSAAARVTALLQ
ncbi:MAG: DUF2079 domain-containing protein [Myxococcales bacterium]|nr:DUF2079 domain-containing protein [Myxococcales bacterium]